MHIPIGLEIIFFTSMVIGINPTENIRYFMLSKLNKFISEFRHFLASPYWSLIVIKLAITVVAMTVVAVKIFKNTNKKFKIKLITPPININTESCFSCWWIYIILLEIQSIQALLDDTLLLQRVESFR